MRTVAAVLGVALLSGACAETPSTTTPSDTVVAAPTTTETFSGTLIVGGYSFYSFVVAQNGTVNVTLTSVSGTDVASTVTIGVAIGTPSGTGCTGGSVTNTSAGTDPQVTGTYSPGRYCVNITDLGNLAAPASFIVTIAHP